MSSIFVDGRKYQVNNKDNILHACLSLGLDIPYFCWHPELGSIGSCRQCMVTQYQNIEDTQGKLIVSCMTPAIDGTIITINDTLSKQFRKFIIELLMINHPHDCPVCEEGGQCHLQDMTVMNHHYHRRYRFKKRTYHNQFLGNFIKHEMNRCITCYRCVRYYKDYADGKDFGVYGSKNNIYFGRYKNGYLENEFSGNLIDICPTGVFTDKINSKHYVRKWDMQFSPSICQYCSIGCNISIGERYSKVRKIENRYHKSINRYFLCDLGRFGYEHLNLNNRILFPSERIKNKIIKLKTNQILKKISEIIYKSKVLIGIGSSRASLESNFALLQLVGEKNYSNGLSTFEQECLLLINKIISSNICVPSLNQIEKEYDAILILGEDLTQTSPRLALSVRQAIKRKAQIISIENKITDMWNSLAISNNSQDDNKYPLFITNVDKTKLDDISKWNYYAPVCEQSKLGFAIAHTINNEAPKVKDLNSCLIDKIKLIAQTLINAKKPLIISGCHSGNISIIQAAYNIAKSLKKLNNKVGINLLSYSCNSLGVNILGGKSLEEISKSIINNNKKTTLIILENDIYRRLPKKKINMLLKKVSKIIVLDHLNTKINKYANLLLPSSNFAETCGTIINYEGRAQRFFQSYDSSYYNDKNKINPSWSWLYAIKNKTSCKKIHFKSILDDLSKKYFLLKSIKYMIPEENSLLYNQKIARAPNRYSGRTAMFANISIHEMPPLKNKDSIFTYSMEGNNKLKNQYIPFVWSPGWNSIQSLNKYQKKIGEDLLYKETGINILKNKTIKYQKSISWFKNIPSKFNKKKGWHVAPYYHLFGSEEITHFSPTINNMIPKSYIVINNIDAKKLNINKYYNFIELNYLGEIFNLPIRISKKLKNNHIGLPIGLPDIPIYFVNAIVDSFKIKKYK